MHERKVSFGLSKSSRHAYLTSVGSQNSHDEDASVKVLGNSNDKKLNTVIHPLVFDSVVCSMKIIVPTCRGRDHHLLLNQQHHEKT